MNVALLGFTVLSVLLIVVVIGTQAIWAWRLAILYPPAALPVLKDEEWPRVSILLPTRGADPSLMHCLEALLELDYPHFYIQVIVDSSEDPAWEVVREVVERSPGTDVRVCVLEQPLQTCSLKVSAMLQALGTLDDNCRVVALIDADVVPHPLWLRDLVYPLRNPAVGAASGLRWYLAEKPNLGSLVRTAWAAGAAAQVYTFGIPWGGSLAFRTDLLQDSNVLEKWAQCFVEDVPLETILNERGLKLEFVPAATNVNREVITLAGCFRFFRRQLFSVRLYHSRWRILMLSGVATPLVIALGLGTAIAALVNEEWVLALAAGGTLVACLGAYVRGLFRVDMALRSMALARGDVLPALPITIAVAAPLTQVIHMAALVSVAFMRSVEWRGVTYEVLSSQQLRMVEYRPYRAESKKHDPRASVV